MGSDRNMGFWASAAVFILAMFAFGVVAAVVGKPAGFFVSVAAAGLTTWYVRRRYARR